MNNEPKTFDLDFISLESISDYYIFKFNKPKDLLFKEGQYGIFKHIDKEIIGRKVRAFSFASTVDDSFLRIGTKIINEPSDFKDKLRKFKLGDKISVNGPVGNFLFNHDQHAVFIAGGIGITPIISILNSFKSIEIKKDINLIYSELNQDYPFKEEIDEIKNLNTDYIYGIDDTIKAVTDYCEKYSNNAIYYMAGSPSFITSLRELLLKNEINPKNIIFDQFIGY